MKNKIAVLILMTIFFNGCSSLEKNYNKISNETVFYKNIASKYKLDTKWWFEYNDEQLNRLIEIGLENNKDLLKAAININKALYEANILGADLVPAFSGSFSSNASKDIKNGSNSNINHNSQFGISYEVDLWQKLSDAKSSKEWEYKATIEDYEKIKFTLINNIINSYFSIIYLENYIEVNKNIVNSYIELDKIVSNKLKYGTADITDKKEAEREILKSKNNIIDYEKQKKEQEILLKNLLNLKPDDNLTLKSRDIKNVKNIGINLDVPVNVIANRPDIKAYEYRLKSMFKNSEAVEKELYPNITLSSSIQYENDKFGNIFTTPIGIGNISINLPFLNWNKIRWNVKVGEAQYMEAKENFEQGITTALNEIDYNYFIYEKEIINYKNLQNIYEYDKSIVKEYENKYKYGKVELKDLIEMSNKEYSSELSVINSKYQIIKSENLVYQSMGGKINK